MCKYIHETYHKMPELRLSGCFSGLFVSEACSPSVALARENCEISANVRISKLRLGIYAVDFNSSGIVFLLFWFLLSECRKRTSKWHTYLTTCSFCRSPINTGSRSPHFPRQLQCNAGERSAGVIYTGQIKIVTFIFGRHFALLLRSSGV